MFGYWLLGFQIEVVDQTANFLQLFLLSLTEPLGHVGGCGLSRTAQCRLFNHSDCGYSPPYHFIRAFFLDVIQWVILLYEFPAFFVAGLAGSNFFLLVVHVLTAEGVLGAKIAENVSAHSAMVLPPIEYIELLVAFKAGRRFVIFDPFFSMAK